MYLNGYQVTLHHTKLIRSEGQGEAAALPPDNGPVREDVDRMVHVSGDSTAYGRAYFKVGDPFWINFIGVHGEAAILVAVQNVNPVTGQPGMKQLAVGNYIVMPNRHPWIDGWRINVNEVTQFVAVSSGSGLEVAEYVLPSGLVGDKIAVAVYKPRQQVERPIAKGDNLEMYASRGGGVGQAGRIAQRHTLDHHDVSYWDPIPVVTFVWTIVVDENQPSRNGDGWLSGVPKAG